MFAAIATVLAGLAARVPENADPSDIATEKEATVVPETELSGKDATADLNVIIGDGATAVTVIMKFAEALNLRFIPFALTCTG